ncbi:V-type ATP synthase subunit A [Rikenella microfusus]|uniref:V-type ATP synthase subunit A n=2 Tax=Rikenella microfusus TaxID=28139 RepID=UPI001E19FA70|nr:V-type ATP synthase subunit A [Rikenella microfusus]HJE88325.1 V-type ATP synthase subunit A [Rikenella microfusus]
MKTTGEVIGIIANLVTVRTSGPVSQNEICYILMDGGVRLMAEVIKVIGDKAYVQVFESTRGLKGGTRVEFEGHMLEATLGPGILTRIYDGLQNDLKAMEGVFLKRGEYNDPLDYESRWDFTPLATAENQEVRAGDWLGWVPEGWLQHKIMVPFKMEGTYRLKWIAPAGNYKITDTIATVVDADGVEHGLSMLQKWPVKVAVTAFRDKPRPFKTMETGFRAIDTFNPIAEGGTGFIPGPFGAGKTVLQHGISKQANADVIIIAACGERANEVVETFVEFPELDDPRTGRKLMERTTIIANTSNMPVSAREASVYTAMTLGEYYRAMGLKVLLLADSTSRWAQALREMSNRLEELPGQDAFPVDLSAIISNFYARAGFVYLNNGQTGSVTFIGTVSPAGGNLKEPVTESTKKAARCFYALSQARADSKRYPAIDPLESYSKYLEYPEIIGYLDENYGDDWVTKVLASKAMVQRGKEAFEQINILGDDGVPVEYHDRYWKSELLDFIILQQDSFDPTDANCPMERQVYMFNLVMDICGRKFDFADFEACVSYYKRLINELRQMNFSTFESDDFKRHYAAVQDILKEQQN